ncbi:MAG: methyltransferase domain-containing protein [Lachnospiraceae bacterium]|nr:methyltransferase domain-containing protein [Lachnospiraceae bacterium]
MEIRDNRIDAGKAFDWGRTSREYAKYRDIYPELFYKKIVDRGLCIKDQKVLDLGTGTGVLPRNLYKYGAKWIGTDISKEQIEQARILTEQKNMEIEYYVTATEDISFPRDTFDVVTACQCFWYFDHPKLMPVLSDILKKDGKLLILYMAWLPFEDKIAGASEELVLKYSPDWSGAREVKKPIGIPDVVYEYFEMVEQEEFEVLVPFTRETWHGRMKACRGVGASLSAEELSNWEQEHVSLLNKIAPESFEVLHYGAFAELKVKK